VARSTSQGSMGGASADTRRARSLVIRALVSGFVIVGGLAMVAALAWLVASPVVGRPRTTVATAIGGAVLLGGLLTYGLQRAVRRGTVSVHRQSWLELREEHARLLRDLTELEGELDEVLDNQDQLYLQLDRIRGVPILGRSVSTDGDAAPKPVGAADGELASVVRFPTPAESAALRSAWRRTLPRTTSPT
jgi:hypothetical protein